MTLTRPPSGQPMGGERPAGTRRIAVFGSTAAERPLRAEGETPAPAAEQPSPHGARVVLERVYAAVAEQAPAIARPVLEHAVAAGAITQGERDGLLAELNDPTADHEDGGHSSRARQALREALCELRRATPGIAEPILTAAVTRGELTAAQEQRILERLRAATARALRASPRPEES